MFFRLEEEGHLDASNEVDLFCLQYVFLLRIKGLSNNFESGGIFTHLVQKPICHRIRCG